MDQKNKSWNRYLGKPYRVGFLFWCFLGAQKFLIFFSLRIFDRDGSGWISGEEVDQVLDIITNIR